MKNNIFRGMSFNNNWIFGYYLPTTDNKAYIVKNVRPINNDLIVNGCRVLPNTVGHSIGRKDKNNREIFTQDVVKVKYLDIDENEQTAVEVEEAVIVDVENNTGYAPFSWGRECDSCCSSVVVIEVEIIGNIHNNPELNNVDYLYQKYHSEKTIDIEKATNITTRYN